MQTLKHALYVQMYPRLARTSIIHQPLAQPYCTLMPVVHNAVYERAFGLDMEAHPHGRERTTRPLRGGHGLSSVLITLTGTLLYFEKKWYGRYKLRVRAYDGNMGSSDIVSPRYPQRGMSKLAPQFVIYNTFINQEWLETHIYINLPSVTITPWLLHTRPPADTSSKPWLSHVGRVGLFYSVFLVRYGREGGSTRGCGHRLPPPPVSPSIHPPPPGPVV